MQPVRSAGERMRFTSALGLLLIGWIGDSNLHEIFIPVRISQYSIRKLHLLEMLQIKENIFSVFWKLTNTYQFIEHINLLTKVRFPVETLELLF